MKFAQVDELYRSNYDAAKLAAVGGGSLAGDDLTHAFRKAERAAEALTKRQVGAQDWQRYRNESALSVRRLKNRGEKAATPFTSPKRSDHREQVHRQHADWDEYREWQQAFLRGGPSRFRPARDA